MMKCFDDRFVVDVNMRDGSNSIVLNASIGDDKSMQWCYDLSP